jgi:diaminohydroxyphosphoribosylaminopyrimidine deaminase/5-amino-6-(5-phosphoribosylamino)uracil reductase
MAYLRAHGVTVSTGEGEREARRLNAPFVTWVTRRRPYVIVKTAVSADGFVGRRDGRVALTGPVADRYFHRQRADVDAIAVGANTVLTDDPQLTARLAYRERSLVRVVFDWRLRIPASARVFSTRSSGPVIMVVSRRSAESRPEDVRALHAVGAEFEVMDARGLGEVLRRLADRDVLSLLVEGGPALQAAFFAAGLVDRVQWVRTPKRLGSGIPAVGFPRDGWPEAAASRETLLGEDCLVETDVHGTD